MRGASESFVTILHNSYRFIFYRANQQKYITTNKIDTNLFVIIMHELHEMNVYGAESVLSDCKIEAEKFWMDLY